MVWILAFLTLTGFNFTFWAIVGFIRLMSEKVRRSVRTEIKRFRSLEVKNLEKRFQVLWLHRALVREWSVTRKLPSFQAAIFLNFPTIRAFGALSHDFPEMFHEARIINVDRNPLNTRYGDANLIVPAGSLGHAIKNLTKTVQDHEASADLRTVLNLCQTARRIVLVLPNITDSDLLETTVIFVQMLRKLNKEIALIAPDDFRTLSVDILRLVAPEIPLPEESIVNLVLRDVPLRELQNHQVKPGVRITPNEVAALVAAHNEALTIIDNVNALKRILPARNIYVGSDASTDKTVEIARSLGVNVVDIQPNRGKAGVLVHLLKTHTLFDRYKAIMIVDADAMVDENYLKRALPFFDDPEVGAVAGHGVTRLKNSWPPRLAILFLAYRIRLWRIVQFGMRYGQTWKHTNLTYIIPGSPSMYRASVLRQLSIDAPGLVIEDFNMTFEFHRKRLGKIAYDPGIFAVHHDPYTFRDYSKQLRRWNLGFWQTMRRHGFWPSAFWFSTFFFVTELYLYSLFVLAIPFIIFWFVTHSFQPITLPILNAFSFSAQLTFLDLVIGIFLVDYFLTIVAAYFEKKPSLLFYGLGFFILRYLDAFIYIYTLPLAFIVKSDGRWVSPERRVLVNN